MSAKSLNLRFAKLQFRGKVRERVYKKLATFLHNGVPLNEALGIMYQHQTDDGRKKSDPVGMVLLQWRNAINNGDTFGQAVKGWVPENDRMIIEGGEKAGLDQAIRDAIKVQAAGKQILGAIWGGLAYPVLLTLVAIAFLLMFSINIVPKFTDVIPRSKWTGAAATVADISDAMYHYLIPGSVAAAAFVAGIWFSMPRWVGKLRVRADKLPPWSLYRLYAGAGFMLVLSAMTKAGVQTSDTLRSLRIGATPWYDERINGALRHVSNGSDIGTALWLTKLSFPDEETVKDLRSYASQDGFDDILRELGEQWIEESISKVKKQTAILKQLGFVVFGIAFGAVAVAIQGLQQMAMSMAGNG